MMDSSSSPPSKPRTTRLQDVDAGTPAVGAPSSAPSSWFSFSTPSLFSWTRNVVSTPSTSSPAPEGAPSGQTSSSWYLDSFHHAAEATYETMTGAVSSLYRGGGSSGTDRDSRPGVGRSLSATSWESEDSPPLAWGANTATGSSLIINLQRQQGHRQRKRGRIVSRTGGSAFDSLASSIFENPYQSVRGRAGHGSDSMTAIRSFLNLVPDVSHLHPAPPDGVAEGEYGHYLLPAEDGREDHATPYYDSAFKPATPTSPAVPTTLETVHEKQKQQPSPRKDVGGDSNLNSNRGQHHQQKMPSLHSRTNSASPPPTLDGSWSSERQFQQQKQQQHAAAETAAHLAEGTIRAWRDMVLEEAVELNAALRFWSERWEKPGLSFLEAGPQVWMSEQGYSHLLVGRRVAQIQAVLARRCSAVGELQQHLLQAGWQKGVAQWGVLGHGGQWATVAGFDGSIQPEAGVSVREEGRLHIFEPTLTSTTHLPSASPLTRQMSDQRILPAPMLLEQDESNYGVPDIPHAGSRIGGGAAVAAELERSGEPRRNASDVGGVADVFVRKRDGGGTFVDDPAFLARWSVDAIALVRRQLFRASNGAVALPYVSNWVTDVGQERPNDQQILMSETGEEGGYEDEDRLLIVEPSEPQPKTMLPAWALGLGLPRSDTAESGELPIQQQQVLITDLSMLTGEVSDLLYVMEDIIKIQRRRRLDRLQPPGWLRRNWYLVASGVPLALWLVRHGRLRFLLSSVVRTIKFFFIERIQGPLTAIFEELWKGRQSFSDKKARKETIEVLQKMIESWLEDSYPDMPKKKRRQLAEAMDVSLVEQKKEEAMKSLGFNTLDVVRMSFIEMQWLKKEMMNALDAMDEVMSANDINMNIAAITPVVMLVYVQSRLIRYLMYSFLSLGTSREETYSRFRAILLDIERLLVMRDNPPGSRNLNSSSASPCVLGPDDLGMLMLLIHECRTILRRERRRFSPCTIRSVSEDLAELAGERGAVSVKQQLLIVSRMTRSYPFLKVISTGNLFGGHATLRME